MSSLRVRSSWDDAGAWGEFCLDGWGNGMTLLSEDCLIRRDWARTGERALNLSQAAVGQVAAEVLYVRDDVTKWHVMRFCTGSQ